MSKTELNNSTALVVPLIYGKSDTCQEYLRMDELLAELPGAIRDKDKAEKNEGVALQAIGIRATLDAPTPFWMVKKQAKYAAGFSNTYYTSVNDRVKDAVRKAGTVAEENLDAYAARVRNYAAEYVCGLIERGDLVDAAGLEVEVPDELFSGKGGLQELANRTPAGKHRLAMAKKNEEGEGGKAERPAEVRCYEKILGAYKIARESDGEWSVRIEGALKDLILPDDMAKIDAKVNK